MKINKTIMRYSSVVLLMLTIFPLFLEAGSSALSLLMISVGTLGGLWGFNNLFEEVRWSQVRQNNYRRR